MKQNKALFVLNIIMFVILIVCLLIDATIVIEAIQIKQEMATNPDAGMIGLGLAVLIIIQGILAIPYAICLVVAVISLCKKYFNWMSITNTVMCGLGVIATVVMFLLP